MVNSTSGARQRWRLPKWPGPVLNSGSQIVGWPNECPCLVCLKQVRVRLELMFKGMEG